MLKKMGLVKDLATKIGRKNATELLQMVQGDEDFVVEVKVKRKGIVSKKEVVTLKDNQTIILEYVEA